MLSEQARAARNAYKKAWRERNKEKIKAYQKQWHEANPEKRAEYEARHWERIAQEAARDDE